MAPERTEPSTDRAQPRQAAPGAQRAIANSLFEHQAIFGRKPRDHALARAVGVEVEPCRVGHRRAQNGTTVALDLVACRAAEIADISHGALEPVERARIIARRRTARQLDL